MKELRWIGSSKNDFLSFPKDIIHDIGFQLHRIQSGKNPSDWKTVHGVPPGVKEIRIWGAGNTFRVIYVTKFSDVIYILHAFQKKGNMTGADQKIIKKRFNKAKKGEWTE